LFLEKAPLEQGVESLIYPLKIFQLQLNSIFSTTTQSLLARIATPIQLLLFIFFILFFSISAEVNSNSKSTDLSLNSGIGAAQLWSSQYARVLAGMGTIF
jgi:hypothetical protein